MAGRFLCSCFLAASLTLCPVLIGTSLLAQKSAGPQPAPLPPPIPAPMDIPYAGTISLSVDLTNVNARILSVHEVMPVKPGDIILLYPQWLPGTHSPSNPVADLAGLVLSADGKRIPWTRDRVDMWAFHVDVPTGATSLDLGFQYLASDPSATRAHLQPICRPDVEQRPSLSGRIFFAADPIRS